jgi:hypothetical protein
MHFNFHPTLVVFGHRHPLLHLIPNYRAPHVSRLLVQGLGAHLRHFGLLKLRSATVLTSRSTSMSAATTSVVVSHFIFFFEYHTKSLKGSTTVYPYNDTAYEPVELGASIFVQVNKNMQRAVHEFNLSTYGFDQDSSMGIWDGERFLYTVRFSPLTALSS